MDKNKLGSFLFMHPVDLFIVIKITSVIRIDVACNSGNVAFV